MSIVSRFLRRKDGGVAVYFGVSLVPLLFTVGTAVDYSKANGLKARLSAATDATSIQLCKAAATTSTAELQAKAQQTVQSYMPSTPVTVDPLEIVSNPRSVTIRSRLSYRTAFVRILNVDTMDIAVKATCSANETYFEIALVLDSSGSMADSGGGPQTKMEAAKQAASNFVDYMFTTGALPGHVKISLVPFTATVAVDPVAYRNTSWIDQAGKSKYHWQNVTSGTFTNRFGIFTKLRAANAAWDWKGCLESLGYPLNTQDGAPSAANLDSYFVPLFSPDEVGNTTKWGTQDVTSPNSYMDDGPSSKGTCQNDDTTDVRFKQACKYAGTLANLRTDQGGPNWKCTSRPLTRLSTSQSALKTEIALYQPGRGTNIHQGVFWGWRTLSPSGVFTDGSAYGSANTVKVIVLMTDGVNTWTASNGNAQTLSDQSAYGYLRNADLTNANSRLPPGNANPATDADTRNAIDALTLETCRNAAAAPSKVVIYTVGFSTPSGPIDAQGLNVLKTCAGAQERAFVANDATALIDAFKSIAQGIGNLRISR